MSKEAKPPTRREATRARSFTKQLSLLVWLLMLLAVPAGLYALYVVGQFESIKQRDLRVLGETADAIDDIIETAAKNLDILLKDRNRESERNFKDEFFIRQAHLRKAEDLDEIDGLLTCTDGKDATRSRFLDSTDLSFKIRVQCKEGAEAETLRVARLDLDSVLESAPSTTTMDLVVVVNSADQVVAQQVPQPEYVLASGAEKTPTVRIRSLEGVQVEGSGLIGKSGDATPVDTDSVRNLTSLRRVKIAEANYELACQPLEVPLSHWSRNAPDGAGTGLSICGFVSEERARQEALQIAPALLLFLVGLTLLGLLAWPILKVVSMARAERLRFGDVYFMLLGHLAIIVFATIAWLDAGLYHSMRQQSFAELRRTANQVEMNVRDELAGLKSQLCRYDQELVAHQAHLDPETHWDMTDLFISPEESDGADGYRKLSEPDVPTLFNSLFWILDTGDERSDGQQVIKATIRRQNTPAVQVKAREYFSEIKWGRAWEISLPADCGAHRPPDPEHGERVRKADSAPQRVYIQTARSLTTGEFFTALSMRSNLELRPQDWMARFVTGDEDGDEFSRKETNVIAAISGPMSSFQHAALSPGLEISVIDQDGLAVFHSDPRRARSERIFRDEGVGDRIRSAVSAGGTHCFAGAYRGQAKLICVQEMRELPWSIVVSFKQQLNFTSNIELLTTAATYALAYLGVLVLLTMALVVIRRRRTPSWMWPHLLHNREYWFWNGIGFLGLLLLFALARVSDSNLWLIAGPAALAGIVLLLVNIRAAGRAVGRQDLAEPINGFCASAFLLWLLVAVIPAKGIFDAAIDAEMPRAVVAEQIAFLQRLEDRACEIPGEFENIKFADGDEKYSRDKILRKRISDPRSVYRFGLFDAEAEDECSEEGSWKPLQAPAFLANLHRTLSNLKPIYNESAAGMRYVGVNEEGEVNGGAAPYRSSYQPERCEERIRVQAPSSPCFPAGAGDDEAYFASGRYGQFPNHELTRNVPLWIVAALLATLHLMFILFVIRRLYLCSIPPTRGQSLRALLDSPPERPTFAVLSTNGQRQACLKSAELPRFDLSRPETPAPPMGAGIVLVTGLETDPGVAPEERLARLQRLEALLASRPSPGDGDDGAVPVILTFDDPRQLVRRLRRYSEASDGASALEAELAAWRRVLGQSDCVYVTVNDTADLSGTWREHCFWNVCNAEERLVLYQVAVTGFVNPKQRKTLTRLLERGLLARDPALRIKDRTFAEYIRNEVSGKELERAMEPTGRMNSRRARWILAGMLAIVVAFLSTTQPDIVESWIQFIVAASAGAAALLKVSSSLFGTGQNS